MATLKSIKNKYLAASDGTVLGVDTNTENISALSFKIATADSLSKFNLVDGFSDDYNDTSGVDVATSTNEVRDSTDNYYKGGEDADGTKTTYSSSGQSTHTNAAGVTSVEIKMWGAGGGNNGQSGGGGGFSSGTWVGSPASFYVSVGGAGANGGNEGGSGGGMSGVWENSVMSATADARLVAGGGGSGGRTGGPGGAGGGSTAENAAQRNPGYGEAGTQSAGGGSGGSQWTGGSGNGAGGNPYGGGGSGQSGSWGSGGGGGGWFGGGRGQGGSSGHGDGGGGGSGYINTTYITGGVTTTGSGETPGNSGDSDRGTAGNKMTAGKVVIQEIISGPAQMTLVSNAFTAQTAPTTARIILDEETAVGSATLDTDLKAYASRDNGTTFTQINLAQQASLDYKTSLLLHCDGANDGVVFTDSSNWAHTPTVSGGTHTDTAVKKFGTASAQFDGTQGDEYLEYASSPQFGFGTGDWTIDFWVRSPNWSAGSGYGTPFDMRPGSSLAGCPRMFFDTGNSNVPGYTDGTSGTKCGSNVVMVNDTWYHIAVVKYSNVTKVYTNGVTGASGAYPTSFADTTNYRTENILRIGDTSVTADPYAFNGYIDEFRITKGMARWTANFTPDTSPYTGTEADRRLISGSVDISGQPAGTDMKYKITTHNQALTKQTRVYGASMAWA